MCEMFSCIAFKSGRVEWRHDTQSHETLIKHLGLDDTGSRTDKREWVRVEVKPNNGNYSLPINEWAVVVDESTCSEWWSEQHEAACRAALAEWAKKHIIKSKKKVDGLTGVIVLSGKPTLTDCEDVRTYDNSAPTLTNCEYVWTWDNSAPTLSGCRDVRTYENSAPTLTNCEYVRTYDNSAPTLTDCEDVRTWDNSALTVTGCKNVRTYENSAPTLSGCRDVWTYDNSAPTLTNCEDVWTWDNSAPIFTDRGAK